MRKVILPGEIIADKEIRTDYTVVENGKTYAAVIGMIDEEGRFIPLEHVYKPKIGDTVIGIVTDSRHAGYSLELNLPYAGFLSSRDFRGTLELGDIVFGEIREVSEVGNVDIWNIRRLPKGKIVEFLPSKIPRLIGKKSSMINLIRDWTKTNIVVGHNGFVWVENSPEIPLIIEIFSIIMKKAHLRGLTDEITELLRNRKGFNPDTQTPETGNRKSETESQSY